MTECVSLSSSGGRNRSIVHRDAPKRSRTSAGRQTHTRSSRGTNTYTAITAKYHISESFLNHTLVTLLCVTSKISPSQINCNVMKLCESVPLNDSFQRISYKMIQWFLDFITDINFTLRFNWVSLTMMFIVISCVLG